MLAAEEEEIDDDGASDLRCRLRHPIFPKVQQAAGADVAAAASSLLLSPLRITCKVCGVVVLLWARGGVGWVGGSDSGWPFGWIVGAPF